MRIPRRAWNEIGRMETPMNRLLLFILSLLLLAACGGTDPAPAVSEDAGPIDIASLPDTINVQTAAALQDRDDVVLIDVREQWEYDAGHIPGITLIPMSEIEARISEIPTDKTVVFACQSGVRSSQVFNWLSSNGYENVYNMAGGFAAWEAAGLDVATP